MSIRENLEAIHCRGRTWALRSSVPARLFAAQGDGDRAKSIVCAKHPPISAELLFLSMDTAVSPPIAPTTTGNQPIATPSSQGLDAGRTGSRKRFASSWALPALTLPLVGLFVFLSGRPLWHTDIWGHLAYGRVIWMTGGLPSTEPLMPLARGVELVDTAWLSQVVGFLVAERFGFAGLQLLSAACVTATFGILAWTGYRKTGNVAWTFIGLAALLWMLWKQLFNGTELAVIIRPQMTGMVAFALTLAVVTSRPRWWQWIVVPVTFAAWGNLHGSFLAGMALLGAFALGRAGDVLRRTDRFGAIVRDWTFWRLILLMQLAAVSVLLNPYGLQLIAEAWLFTKNANLDDLVEWKPLTLRMNQGQAAAAVAFVLMFLYRSTPRRIGTGEAIALLFFGGVMLWTSRMIVWWAPIAAYCLMVHGTAMWQTSRASGSTRRTTTEAEAQAGAASARRIAWSGLAVGIVIGGVLLTPWSRIFLLGAQPPKSEFVSARTPTGASRHLGENPPPGLVFNTYELGDYLLWSNPGLPIFVATHAHLIPREVWLAYTTTIRGGGGWEATLDQYGVEAVVLDRPARQTFIDRLSEEPDWRKTYEDYNSAVFRRTRPLQ